MNVIRIGFVASEITKAGGIAICALIAPYAEARAVNRKMISQYGGYIEVHVATPIKECERRDPKGLYTKARAGVLRGFTGIDDPYEDPVNPEIRIDTTNITPDEAANAILAYLKQEKYLEPAPNL
jgi:sulfate adenylyltransferase